MRFTYRRRRGIGRQELALVVAAVAALIAIGIPFIYHQRHQARRETCAARQFHTSLAVLQSSYVHQRFPGYRDLQAADAREEPQASSWVFPILPYLHPIDAALTLREPDEGQAALSGREWTYDPVMGGPISFNGPYAEVFQLYGPNGGSEHRGKPPQRYLPVLVCPENPPPGGVRADLSYLSWVANCGMPDAVATDTLPADWLANGVFTDQFPAGRAIEEPTTVDYLASKDGLANVIMLSENVDAGLWTDTDEALVGMVWTTSHSDAPTNLFKDVWSINQNTGEGDGTLQSARPSAYHVNGVNVVLCNGATRFITEDVDDLVWIWLMLSDSQSPRYPGTEEWVAPPLRRLPPSPVEESDPQSADPSDEDRQGSAD